jgi:hypothetical protein
LFRDTQTPTQQQLMLLRRNLTDYFGDDELRALCSEMGLDYERLRGQGKAAKASQLVRSLAAHGRILELVARASRLRPDVPWGDLATGTDSPLGRPAPPGGSGPPLRRLGWLAVALIATVGLIFVLSGGLNRGRPEVAPSPAPGTPTLAPTTSAPAAPTLAPIEATVTATPLWTPSLPAETSTPPPLEMPTLAPTGTPTPYVSATRSMSRVVTPQVPPDGACIRSSVITFKWTGAALRWRESFLVAITPSEVNKGKCTSNYSRGVQYSPPLTGSKWTTDISSPAQVPAACAGPIEWTVYIKSAAGNVTQVAPQWHFEWNPSGCNR